ncbi:hypothetical protein AnigIFM50267_010788 [Aspergillus niger]|nr:hypothetical protein AnigIFM50267_010788 [Aspergillus niger]
MEPAGISERCDPKVTRPTWSSLSTVTSPLREWKGPATLLSYRHASNGFNKWAIHGKSSGDLIRPGLNDAPEYEVGSRPRAVRQDSGQSAPAKRGVSVNAVALLSPEVAQRLAGKETRYGRTKPIAKNDGWHHKAGYA